ncbi:MAG: hypothetical protein NTZ97_05010 [Candidatus Moranbacteria bacterium]|nr:hypothetical protein [Candidatus Moranbacteria bacterium]
MNKQLPDILAILSVITVIVSGYVSLAKVDVFGLAGTQWMLIGIVLGIYALYTKMRAK